MDDTDIVGDSDPTPVWEGSGCAESKRVEAKSAYSALKVPYSPNSHKHSLCVLCELCVSIECQDSSSGEEYARKRSEIRESTHSMI